MERVGISQKNLGILSGIDPSVASSRINHYATGRHVPNFSMLEKMAKVLKLPVAFFYTPDDDLARLLISYHQLPGRAKKELARTSDRLLAAAKD